MSTLEAKQASFHAHVRDLQDRISDALHAADPGLQRTEDLWSRQDHRGDDGGGGRTRVFYGDVIENAGVNTSCVYGALDPRFAAKLGGDGEARLWAAGISLIIHPRNPRVPTVHANYRLIQLGDAWWFGGGADLTPYYPHTEDFVAFHQALADACTPWGCYPEMKASCDGYFVNHHREGEMRGVGGIFYDRWNRKGLDTDYAMSIALSEAFIPAYFPIVERRKDEAFTDADVDFQLYRRGRYVEFNLLHDRGTKFGLETRGRTESILVSLPARCGFRYNWTPEPGTPHAEMNRYYWPRDWLKIQLA